MIAGIGRCAVSPLSFARISAMSGVMNKYSRVITQDIRFGGPQAMLYATGLSEDDMQRPQVGIVANWYDGNPCNMHLNELAARVKEGVVAAGLVGMRFNTIGVSDGISQGTDGMSYSLPSRDIIADSIETVMSAQWYDGIDRHPGLRQEHARLRDGHGPVEPPGAGDLRRHDPPRRAGRPAAGYRLGPGGLRRVPLPAGSTTPPAGRSFAIPAPVRGPAAECTRPTPCPA